LTFLPELPDEANDLDQRVALDTRVTPFGQATQAYFESAADQNLVTQLVRAFEPADLTLSMSREEWEESEHFRPGVEFDDAMTAERAEAIASRFDQRRYRERLQDQSTAIGGTVAMIGGSLAGAALEPTNYIPVVGPAMRAASIAKAGNIGGRAITGAVDAGVMTAATSPIVADLMNREGEDIGLSEIMADIAFSSVVGSAFGAGSGVVFKAGAIPTSPSQIGEEVSRSVDGISGLAEDLEQGNIVDVPDNSFRVEGTIDEDIDFDIETSADPWLDRVNDLLKDLPEDQAKSFRDEMQSSVDEFDTVRQEADVSEALIGCTLRFANG